MANQVHQLVSASEADPDRGFTARMMALCSLPRTNPGNRLQFRVSVRRVSLSLSEGYPYQPLYAQALAQLQQLG